MLAQNGLGLLGSALMEKGQKVVEDKLGVKLTAKPTQEQVLQLKQLEYAHEEWLLSAGLERVKQELEYQKVQEEGVTSRWKADMASDSWLSKNIRPIVLLSLLFLFLFLVVIAASGWKVDDAYLSLLKEWGMLVLGAYFGGRTFEKITSMKQGDK